MNIATINASAAAAHAVRALSSGALSASSYAHSSCSNRNAYTGRRRAKKGLVAHERGARHGWRRGRSRTAVVAVEAKLENMGLQNMVKMDLNDGQPTLGGVKATCPRTPDQLFEIMRQEAQKDSAEEPTLASFLHATILSHTTLRGCLSFLLGNKLGSSALLDTQLMNLFRQALDADETMEAKVAADIVAVYDRDPACDKYSTPLLYFKGFQALQAHRVSHWLWLQDRKSLALALQSRVSEVFHVDIHPAAEIGRGIFLDHATGIVVGETARIGDNVSILHHVTLGGTGAIAGKDRHPKIGSGVLIGAGVTILGNIEVGDGAKIGAGSVVLTPIPDHATAVGVPAKVLKRAAKTVEDASLKMDQTSFVMDMDAFDYNI